jgi:membrane associated rhomboid family serine protease
MAILVANILVFLYERTLPHAAQLAFQQRYALSLEGVLHGGVWQFFTYQFLHGGVTHLVFNLIFLHSFGPVMETTLGMKRYLALYCWSGVFGGFVQLLAAWCSPGVIGDHPVVGASASLCGLLSALCALYSEEKLDIRLFFVIPVVLRAKFLLLVMAAISAGGILIRLGNVAHAAHLGGLLAGLIFLNLFRVEPLSGVADA